MDTFPGAIFTMSSGLFAFPKGCLLAMDTFDDVGVHLRQKTTKNEESSVIFFL
jgi:hypothetical protein